MITMDYSYVFLILLLPALSFILLGLAGMKMSHKAAGLIGTCSLALVTILSYYCAFQYFGADRVVDNHIKRLRKALGHAGKQIHTVVGRGYKLTEK